MKARDIFVVILVGLPFIIGWTPFKSSNKAKSQLEFEGRHKDIHLARYQAEWGTRKHEAAHENLNRFISNVEGMIVERWVCKYSDLTPYKFDYDRLINNEYFSIECKDPDARNGDEYNRGTFYLRIPKGFGGLPEKVYKGDMIRFSAVAHHIDSIGFIPKTRNDNSERNDYKIYFGNVTDLVIIPVKN